MGVGLKLGFLTSTQPTQLEDVELSIILCTHHKGGVGKTTLSVHIAGILSEKLGRTLLIDCDSQGNSHLFYLGAKENRSLDLKIYNEKLSIIWNPEKRAIRRFADFETTYDHIVLDIDSPLAETVRVIIDNHPDKVLVPVNDHPWSISGLSETLPVIAKLDDISKTETKVVIVPLGASIENIKKEISNISKLPKKFRIARRMRFLRPEFNQALKEQTLIWNYERCEDLKIYFNALLYD
jgi:chromosome partitioning protein